MGASVWSLICSKAPWTALAGFVTKPKTRQEKA